MSDPLFIDFYRGWSIEIIRRENGFSSRCCSPSHERINNDTIYSCDFQAIAAAQQTIDQQQTRKLLASFLRELYEIEQISFQEWRSLHQSVFEPLNAL